MTDLQHNQSQVRAHKKNLGALQTLAKQLDQLRKDERKSLQNIDQQAMDAHKFLGILKENLQLLSNLFYLVSFSN